MITLYKQWESYGGPFVSNLTLIALHRFSSTGKEPAAVGTNLSWIMLRYLFPSLCPSRLSIQLGTYFCHRTPAASDGGFYLEDWDRGIVGAVEGYGTGAAMGCAAGIHRGPTVNRN